MMTSFFLFVLNFVVVRNKKLNLSSVLVQFLMDNEIIREGISEVNKSHLLKMSLA